MKSFKMLIEDMEDILPNDWQPMDLYHERYKVISIPKSTPEYQAVINKILGNYYTAITRVYKIQNPLLYCKFRLKAHDYEKRGAYEVMTLFHDTSRENVESIITHNFDWRFGSRFMFGPGVYFSISPTLANKHSSKMNGMFRSMFITDVLIQKVQKIGGDIFLPDYGFDTALCHNGDTFVKYFDCEYYPQYVVDYISV